VGFLGTPSSGSGTSVTIAGGMPSGENRGILGVCGLAIDSTATQSPGWSNGDIGNLTDRGGVSTSAGAGGGLQFWSGEKASATAIGETTGTISSPVLWHGVLLEIYNG
jgi:hypothetical protein